MKFVPVLLLFGIILNVCCVLIFRLKLDRHYKIEFSQLSNNLKTELAAFAADSLRSIDNYFVSNRLSFVTSATTNHIENVTTEEVFYKDGGEWYYVFFRFDGLDYARVGIVDFLVGSPFPRGGTITAIYPDFVVVDDKFSIRNKNSSYTQFSPSSSNNNNNDSNPQIQKFKTEYKPNEELTHYVKSTHTNR